ncbi:hypothetical protein ThidrDRAFT_1823 [Thiorhodococcus drewsii AZ1]|uniref:DUF2249 domain-containing protein n=1 Tax=Thiorhodococcus drewsii AZ1 TaxID=765913 RepID=G2E0Y5_9GAMM|nr:DUF2249 domain-containing protein [Thiorhodococcus drewsii]EGV31622.1 hypothetical protein ThidrDRAFT_1823 [Thiorhodococcus drewsii AZ1]
MSEPVVPQVLDVSRLAPPEPLERVLDALADLPAGRPLWVLHRREPFPLYDLLRRMGYGWRTLGEDPRVEILIWPLANPPSEAELAWRIPS